MHVKNSSEGMIQADGLQDLSTHSLVKVWLNRDLSLQIMLKGILGMNHFFFLVISVSVVGETGIKLRERKFILSVSTFPQSM